MGIRVSFTEIASGESQCPECTDGDGHVWSRLVDFFLEGRQRRVQVKVIDIGEQLAKTTRCVGTW